MDEAKETQIDKKDPKDFITEMTNNDSADPKSEEDGEY